MSDKEAGRDKMLDEILDSGLAEYSQVEPRPGLENRILAGLASDERAVKWNWRWVVAFAAACIVIALLVAPREKKRVPAVARTPTEKTEATTTASLPKSASVPRVRNTTNRNLRRFKTVATAPKPVVAVAKQPVFPAPSPLSEQEKSLFAYLRKTPYQELVQNSKPDEPRVESEINQVMPGREKFPDRDSNSR
jgi:hypothetical protein